MASRSDKEVGCSDLAPEMELGRRLAEVVARIGGTQRRAAEIAGVSLSQFKRYLSGLSDPPLKAASALAREAGVSLQWLAMGEGTMFGAPASLDEKLLRDVCEVIEEYLDEQNATLTPKKKSQAIAALYEMHVEPAPPADGNTKLDTGKVRRLLRLVS